MFNMYIYVCVFCTNEIKFKPKNNNVHSYPEVEKKCNTLFVTFFRDFFFLP